MRKIGTLLRLLQYEENCQNKRLKAPLKKFGAIFLRASMFDAHSGEELMNIEVEPQQESQAPIPLTFKNVNLGNQVGEF
jgi:hypothetical protein